MFWTTAPVIFTDSTTSTPEVSKDDRVRAVRAVLTSWVSGPTTGALSQSIWKNFLPDSFLPHHQPAPAIAAKTVKTNRPWLWKRLLRSSTNWVAIGRGTLRSVKVLSRVGTTKIIMSTNMRSITDMITPG